MTAKYVLLLLITNSYNGGAGALSQEFHSKESCMVSAQEFSRKVESVRGARTTWVCVPK